MVDTALATFEAVPERFNMARHCLGPAAHRPPDRTALIVAHADPAVSADAGERWTFGELDTAVRAVAGGLRSVGVRPGDRVVLRLGNTSAYPLAFFGAIAAGAVAVPTSTQLTAEEFDFVVRDSAAALVVHGGDDALELSTGIPVVGEADLAQWQRSTETNEPANEAAYADTGADDPAFLVYTSGTTDRPKGVLHAQRSIWGRQPMYPHWLGLRADDVMLHAGAFNWTYTLGVGLSDPWARGACAVVYDGPREPTVWPRLIDRYAATIFAAVPGVYRQWLHDWQPAAGALASLRHGVVAGEALSPALWQAWREATGRPLYEALGMSEISTFVSSGPTTPTRPGSPGRIQPGRRVTVLPVDAGTSPVATGEIGLLAVDRDEPGLMLGYWRRPQEDAASRRGRWFVTSDLVHLDDDGYVHYHGRNDDVMTAQGYRISPVEVEKVLAGHPGIADVAVTEVEVREGVRVVAAFVVPRGPLDPQDVRAFAGAHLAAYKCPRIVRLVEVLPRTPNGKIRRRDLSQGI